MNQRQIQMTDLPVIPLTVKGHSNKGRLLLRTTDPNEETDLIAQGIYGTVDMPLIWYGSRLPLSESPYPEYEEGNFV